MNFKDFPFNPDFYLPTLDLYIEHVSDISHPIRDKEQQFKQAGKLLFKIHEDMNHDIRGFHQALDRITAGKIDVELKNPTLKYEDEFRMYHDKVKDFLYDVKQLNDKVKVENLDFGLVYAKSQQHESVRISRFYQLAREIIQKYNEYCEKYAYLDFNELLIKSLEILKKKQHVRRSIQVQTRCLIVGLLVVSPG